MNSVFLYIQYICKKLFHFGSYCIKMEQNSCSVMIQVLRFMGFNAVLVPAMGLCMVIAPYTRKQYCVSESYTNKESP